jgi:hypothetical protein
MKGGIYDQTCIASTLFDPFLFSFLQFSGFRKGGSREGNKKGADAACTAVCAR